MIPILIGVALACSLFAFYVLMTRKTWISQYLGTAGMLGVLTALMFMGATARVQAVVTAIYDPTTDMTSMLQAIGQDMQTFYPAVLALLLTLLILAFLWKLIFGRKK